MNQRRVATHGTCGALHASSTNCPLLRNLGVETCSFAKENFETISKQGILTLAIRTTLKSELGGAGECLGESWLSWPASLRARPSAVLTETGGLQSGTSDLAWCLEALVLFNQSLIVVSALAHAPWAATQNTEAEMGREIPSACLQAPSLLQQNMRL